MTSKYHREIKGAVIDVYDILNAYEVKCPAVAHAVKKLLMLGRRGYKDYSQDLSEAGFSIDRAKSLPSPSKIISRLEIDQKIFEITGINLEILEVPQEIVETIRELFVRMENYEVI
jgi:hypothetical protein